MISELHNLGFSWLKICSTSCETCQCHSNYGFCNSQSVRLALPSYDCKLSANDAVTALPRLAHTALLHFSGFVVLTFARNINNRSCQRCRCCYTLPPTPPSGRFGGSEVVCEEKTARKGYCQRGRSGKAFDILNTGVNFCPRIITWANATMPQFSLPPSKTIYHTHPILRWVCLLLLFNPAI